MPGSDAKSDLPGFIEGGTSQGVLVFFVSVQKIRYDELVADEDLRRAFEANLKEQIGVQASLKDLDATQLSLDKGEQEGALVKVVVTPPKGGQAQGLLAQIMHRKTPHFNQALQERLAKIRGLADEPQAMKVELKTPTVGTATWPKVKLDKKVPNTVWNLVESLHALDDTREVQGLGPDDKATDADLEFVRMEVGWALPKIAEVLKDAKLERLFVMQITNLLKQDRRGCNLWAGSLAPSVLQFILTESPMKEQICRNSFGVARQEWQLYAQRCKTCVAIAILACAVQEQWSSSFTAEDKAFLSEAADKLSNWPGLTVGDARGLWDRSTSRYVVVNGLVVGKKEKTAESAMACLRKCPRDIVCSRFPAPWRKRPEQEASFFYLYAQFQKHAGAQAAEGLCECLAQAYGSPSADILGALRAYIEDSEVSLGPKRDCLVSFISACRLWKPPPPDKKAKVNQEVKAPDTSGVELILLESLVKVFTSNEGGKNLPGYPELCERLGMSLEVVLLLSSGDTLYEWARKMRTEDRMTSDATKRFLDQVATKSIARFLTAAGSDRAFRYDDGKVALLVDGKKAWTFDGRKQGFFSEWQTKGGRQCDDIGQVVHMFVKLDLALSGGCSAKLVKIMDEDSECLATRFNRVCPESSTLRKAINQDVRRNLGAKKLEVMEIDKLLSYIGFFHPSFQSFLRHEHALSDLRACFSGVGFDEMAFSLMEVVMKLLSVRSEATAGHSVREVMVDMCDQVRNDPLTGQLFSQVLEELQRRNYTEVGDGFDTVQLRDCAKELRKASQLIQYKQARGVSESLLTDTERVIRSFLKQTLPKSWVSSFRSLDTVIFALEYMGKEDLQLAYERFEEECKNSQQDQLVDLIRCVRKIYPTPLSGTDTGITPDMDVKQLFKTKAPRLSKQVLWHGIPFVPSDWEKVLEISAAAAEAMKERYNVLMLPHHTQIITLVMFGFRVCGAGASGAGFRELPKTLLARVGTGEGKSMIIGMLAAFVAKKGMRAHVINDDRLLTQRDFATNEKMFKALGISASNSAKDLKNQSCKIVYCTGDDVEGSCLDSLTDGEVEKYEDELRETVLIVDEVDGMVFDKGVTSNKLFEDREFSDKVNEWLTQLSTGGKIANDWDDWRSMGESSKILQAEVEAAYNEVGEKEEGHDYTRRGDEVYMMDTRTGKISEHAWSLWLEIMRSQKTDPPSFVHYKYVKAILCRLQCFMSYSCIFGLTGSLGQSAEKIYLAEHYQAVSFNVPFFLDTCRDENKGVLSKKVPTLISDTEPLPSLQDQDRSVIALAAEKCSEVPVLVIARDPEDVDVLAKDLESELDRLYGQEPVDGEDQGEDGEEKEEGVPAPKRVIQLLHNPRNPKEFVELVGCATEPVRSRAAGGPGGVRQRWPVTLTTAEGGRGHDYRVTDPSIDENGGLLLILTWVPFSEREWIQFLGRTGRQDHCGQYAVLLSYEDEEVEASKELREPGESFVQAMLRHSDQETAKMLTGFDDEITKGRLMHKLTSRYFTQHKQDKTTKRQDWYWKQLCETYLQLDDNQAIQKRFDGIIPPEVRLVVDADMVDYDGQFKGRLTFSPQIFSHPGDSGCLDSEIPAPVVQPPAESGGNRKKQSQGKQAAAAPPSIWPEEHIYDIRTISFFGMDRRILCAPRNLGSSPLLSLCNVLLLRNQLALPDQTNTIASQELIDKVTNLLLDLHAGDHVDSDPRCAELQQQLHVAMEVLPSLRLAMELDYRFCGPADFLHKRECSVFELLEIAILHGWVVSPMDKEAYSIVSPHSHNELCDRLVELEAVREHLESGYPSETGLQQDELMRLLQDIQVIEDVPIIRDFLERSSAQLTYEGIIQLHEAMGDREVAVFFRNHNFSTMLRNKDELFLLCTDTSFVDTPVVWERLAAADTDMAYVDTDFRVPHSLGSLGQRQPVLAGSRGPRLEGNPERDQQASGPAPNELRCRRCGIINQFPVAVPGQGNPTMRCGACGEVQICSAREQAHI